jgi:hypothetical protein
MVKVGGCSVWQSREGQEGERTESDLGEVFGARGDLVNPHLIREAVL